MAASIIPVQFLRLKSPVLDFSRILETAVQKFQDTAMTEEFPRLLVATEFPPNAAGGGGAIVRQMLQGWPVEKLSWWSCLPEGDRGFGQQVAAHRVAAAPDRLRPNRRLARQKAWLMDTFWVPRATRHLRQTLTELRPEVVWVIPHAWSIAPLARVLPGAGIGFHVSVHDYPDLKNQVDSLGGDRCDRWLKGLEQLYAHATTRDAICQPMVDDLRRRTQAGGTVIRAGLEAKDFERLQTPVTADAGNPIRIAYAGTIHVPEVFAQFVAVLGKIRRQLPRPVRLDFFGNHSCRGFPWFDASWMTEHGNLPAQPLNEALRKCTWGFSPMAMTDEDPSYNRFSFPTKFVSYLTAGLPVLSLGQPASSILKMAAAYETGVCLTTVDETVLAGQLLAALNEPAPGAKYHPGLRRCAEAEFDGGRMRTTLHGFLKNSAFLSDSV